MRGKINGWNEIETSDISDYDRYIAICRNLKYTKEHYDLRYYSDMHEGVKSNPVAQIHLADLSSKICGTKVLSIGCGTGIMEYWLKQKRPEVEIIGTDFTVTDIQKELWDKYELDVTISEAASQPFTDDSFDTVYTSHVLEHVINLKDVIIESIRLSKIAAVHLVPINLNNPDHIHFFKLGAIDNEHRTQEANIDLKVLADEVIEVLKVRYPNMSYEWEISCPRDGSRDYGNINFHIRKPDRPDGLMPCFLISFFKMGQQK
ncbi:MAG: hypothetical protein A2W05_04385 [Candidatus Schekmanbacteria bacterium RBG_16_38_10]|uniref:Methyltransferase type 11 domain-containing protein n=1 Tax=Candidatus Schekmanbacteria bacterium RBG_16_38_10 TaxID=1817879 RepID=A0A1F7S232_9BACT|nr:MAG: hypothetical protein A2W05_04385 [Candidatus Schekmanbacteria bacterium RBG_16_38_10]